MALRRTAVTASTLFTTKFRHFKTPSISIAPPSAIRFFAASSSDENAAGSSSTKMSSPVRVQGPLQYVKMENPFQSDGPGGFLEVDEVKGTDSILFRMVFPGVGDDGLRIWTENNTVFFSCKGEKETDDEGSRRKYGGSIEFNPVVHRAEGLKAEMKNGILRLTVPNAEGVSGMELV